MKLQFSLVENLLTTAPGNYRAIIRNTRTSDLNDIVDDMVDEGTGLTRPQAMAYCEKLCQLIERRIVAGYRVNLPFVNIHTSIKGSFDGENAVFDASQHAVKLCCSPGVRLRAQLNDIRVEKISGTVPAPRPLEIYDDESGLRNRIVTPGEMAALYGSGLKFDRTDMLQGLFFISMSDPSKIVRCEKFIEIKPSSLYFKVPTLTAGKYRIEVRSIHFSKELRIGLLKTPVEVL